MTVSHSLAALLWRRAKFQILSTCGLNSSPPWPATDFVTHRWSTAWGTFWASLTRSAALFPTRAPQAQPKTPPAPFKRQWNAKTRLWWFQIISVAAKLMAKTTRAKSRQLQRRRPPMEVIPTLPCKELLSVAVETHRTIVSWHLPRAPWPRTISLRTHWHKS